VFATTTFELADEPLHVVAAVFFHGREDVIPRMFLPLVRSLREQGIACDLLLGYLERHIAVDSGDHRPLARRMLDELFESSAERRAEAARGAERALAAREALWDQRRSAADLIARPSARTRFNPISPADERSHTRDVRARRARWRSDRRLHVPRIARAGERAAAIRGATRAARGVPLPRRRELRRPITRRAVPLCALLGRRSRNRPARRARGSRARRARSAGSLVFRASSR